MGKTEALESSKEEVERKLALMGGDMIKMEYLENCLKKPLPFDTKKFVHLKLSALYEARLMIGAASRNMKEVIELASSPKEKKDAYLKTIELLIKEGNLLGAEDLLNKAIGSTNSQIEKHEYKERLKQMYENEALRLEKSGKINHATKIYERLFASDTNNITVIKKLAEHYTRLGKIRESINMQNILKNKGMI